MPAIPPDVIATFTAPIEGVIVSLGQGIAEAQALLDKNSIATQHALDSDPEAAAHGLQATWYQFPRVDLQLKIALAMTQQATTQAAPIAAPLAPGSPRAISLANISAIRLLAQPVSAAYQNHFNYDVTAASTITLSIVPVPGSRSGSAALAPKLTRDQVQSDALKALTQFRTKTTGGTVVPDPSFRFDVNFNAASRTWYVLQYDPANPSTNPVVASVDDVTEAVHLLSS
jgi:hypothetical protein